MQTETEYEVSYDWRQKVYTVTERLYTGDIAVRKFRSEASLMHYVEAQGGELLIGEIKTGVRNVRKYNPIIRHLSDEYGVHGL